MIIVEGMKKFSKPENCVDLKNNFVITYKRRGNMNKKTNDKMRFLEFNCLVMEKSKMERLDCSIYVPIIYKMSKKYFNAAVLYLETGKITNLKVGKISIMDIINGYFCKSDDYLKALVVLNNIEKAKEDAYLVFNPHIVE